MSRKTCVVLGCKSSTAKFPECEEVICPKHWRLVAGSTKRRHRRLEAEMRRLVEKVTAIGAISEEQRARGDRLDRLCTQVWRIAKAQAIGRAAGLR